MLRKVLLCFVAIVLFIPFYAVEASPLIMVEAEGIVDGYVGENIGSKAVELKLSDDHYSFAVDDYEDISDWFVNLPEGLEAYVTGHLPDNIHVSIEGIPQEECEELIKVAVPDGFIIDGNSMESIGILENSPSEKGIYQIRVREPAAVYDRESVVKGTVGSEIALQQVYVKLVNTTWEASMLHHEFEDHNGLKAKVIDLLSENIVVIEYSGIPLEEDTSLIHTVLKNEDLKCDQDLVVEDREDVRFDIHAAPVSEEIEIPSYEEETVPYPIPVTGVE